MREYEESILAIICIGMAYAGFYNGTKSYLINETYHKIEKLRKF